MSKKIPYHPFSSFVLRTPLMSYTDYMAITSKHTVTEDELKNIYNNPVIQESIFLASPNLYSELNKWIKNEIVEDKDTERLQFALLRYFTRMSTRCTPFGLFAGISLGSLGSGNHIELSDQQIYNRHTRLDMGYLCALSHDLAQNEGFKQNLKYYTNSSAYELGDKIRYVEYRYIKRYKTYHLVEVDNSEVLEYFLEIAKDGVKLNDLVKILIANDASDTEANAFVEELVSSQLLIPDIEPNVTGPEFFDQLFDKIIKLPNSSSISNTLSTVDTLIKKIDNTALGETTGYYHKIADKLKELGTDLELKNLFQTDLKKPTQHCTLDKKTAYDVLRGVRALNKLSYRPMSANFKEFKEAFERRYENQEIPLVEALDTETGIGYKQFGSNFYSFSSPLVDDLAVSFNNEDSKLKWNKIESFILQKCIAAAAKNKYEIALTDEELQPFEERWDDLPLTFSIVARIFQEESNSTKERIHISWAHGATAASWLGRFCHVDNEIHNYTKQIVDKEKELEPAAILAEIAHLPQERTGNIIVRPTLRAYEIPYFAKSSVDKEFQINLEDLMISIRNGRIVLRSKRLNKEVIPYLSCAHAYANNTALPIYFFLCDLNAQNKRGNLRFYGGQLGDHFSFSPRITYKNIILSLAQWTIELHEIEHLFKIKESNILLEKFTEWRLERNMPVLFTIDVGDNKMLINSENAMCIKMLFSLVKKMKRFELRESLYDKNKAASIVKSQNATFLNEVILSYHRSENN